MSWSATLRIAALTLASVLATPAHASFGNWLQEKALGLEQHLAHLDTRTVTVDKHEMLIHTRALDSKQPCVLMVHGFTARGAHWFRMARRLPADRCLIVVDLPGFGASTFTPGAAYDPATQADRLSALLTQLKPGNPQVDYIGNSMGGFIGAEFALRHPAQTHSLALLDAAGVSSPVPSTLRRQIEAGKNGFFARDLAEFRVFYAMTMADPPFVPGIIIDANGEEAVARVPRHQVIFNQLNGPRLDARLKDIHVPTLIVWGDQDQLLHVSMVPVWQRIPGSRAYILKDVGHMPHLERPAQTAELYTRFLNHQL